MTHTQLVVPQLAGVNVDIPLHDRCDRALRKGQSRQKGTAKAARPGGRLIKFEAAQWSAAQNRRVIGVNWGAIEALRTRGDNAEKIDRRQGKNGRNFVKSCNCKVRRPQIKERLNGVSEFAKPRGERKLRERGEREGWRLRRARPRSRTQSETRAIAETPRETLGPFRQSGGG